MARPIREQLGILCGLTYFNGGYMCLLDTSDSERCNLGLVCWCVDIDCSEKLSGSKKTYRETIEGNYKWMYAGERTGNGIDVHWHWFEFGARMLDFLSELWSWYDLRDLSCPKPGIELELSWNFFGELEKYLCEELVSFIGPVCVKCVNKVLDAKWSRDLIVEVVFSLSVFMPSLHALQSRDLPVLLHA